MGPHRVLIVDDEGEQRRLYRRLLESEGLETAGAASGYEALELVKNPVSRPDLILSDVSMPGLDGITLVKALRATPETTEIPAILMTGLNIPRGMMDLAADVLGVGPVFIKGGELRPLVARVMAALRASDREERGIVVDPIKRAVWVNDFKLPELPPRRFQLLCALLRRPDGLSREELLEQVWDGNDNANIVDVTILRLRQDLKGFPFMRIETLPAGYRLDIGPYTL